MVWDGDLVTTLVGVNSVSHCLWPVPRCFEAGYRPGHRMFDCFEMHICMKHIIYYRLVITLNVALQRYLIDCTELHYFMFEFSTFLRGGAFPDHSLAVISCFTPMLWGLIAALHLSHAIGFLPIVANTISEATVCLTACLKKCYL